MKYGIAQLSEIVNDSYTSATKQLQDVASHTSRTLQLVTKTVVTRVSDVVDLSHTAQAMIRSATTILSDVEDRTKRILTAAAGFSHTAQQTASSVMETVQDSAITLKDTVCGINEALGEAFCEAAWLKISKIISHNFPLKDHTISHADVEINTDEIVDGTGLYAQYARAIYPDEGKFNIDPSLDDEITIITDEALPAEDNSGLYRCAIVMNHKERKVTFVVSGTRFDNTKAMMTDLLDDMRLGLGLLPKKVEAAIKLNDYFLRDFAREYDFDGWEFIYTGHSLGAALADAAATDLACKLYAAEVLQPGMVSTKTFENPGSKNLVVKLVERNADYGSDITVDIITQNVQFLSFNNSKSLIHIPGQEIGTVFHINHTNSPLSKPLETMLARFKCKNLAHFLREVKLHKISYIIDALGDKTQAEILRVFQKPNTGQYLDQRY